MARDLPADAVIVPPDVGHRQRNQLGESAGAIDPHALRRHAQMAPAREAVAASSADHMAFAADDVAGTVSLTLDPTSTISPTNSCPMVSGTLMVRCAHSSHL